MLEFALDMARAVEHLHTAGLKHRRVNLGAFQFSDTERTGKLFFVSRALGAFVY